ncbi:hypothetical protein IAU60_006765 [Kwoniella sp. DSM 27419]
MDLIENLAKQASQITMYDVKSYYEQAKNMVLNVTEMEAKVREATNDDPWGASSTLMQQIADGAQFNEIMPTIYSRFMEKEAREWRQIYKALTLLEFLVKNGSERVVDDARAHVSTIKMLRSFHYIDEKGKDQGINVRNRASEIALLLGDVDRIRTERRKAKANKSKYRGTGNDGGMSFVTAGGSRYGGFGSDSLGAGGGGGGSDAGSGSRFGGEDEYRSSSRTFRDTSNARQEYDEYEGADDFDDQPPRRATSTATRQTGAGASGSGRSSAPPKPVAKETKPVEKPKEVNLFDFDDEPVSVAPAAPVSAPITAGGDDDFDDFQEAPSAPAAAPRSAGGANANLFDLLGSTATASAPGPGPASQASAPRMPSLSSPSYAQPPASSPSYGGFAPSQPAMQSRPSYSSSTVNSPPATKPTPKSTFDDLFASSLSSMGGKSTPTGQQSQGKTIKDLEKEKTMSSLWGPTPGSSGAQGQAAKPSTGNDFDDLLM